MNPNVTPPITPKQQAQTRPVAVVPPEVQAKHDASKRKYPNLSLSSGEYVVEEIRRHPIGILSIWFITGLVVVIVLAALTLYGINHDYIASMFMVSAQDLPSAAVASIPALLVCAVAVLGGFIATIIYEGNKFYITSESIVQHIQTGLFTTKQQVVNLINVEDASSSQANFIEQVLNYGTLTLSTQGEETHYHFRFVAKPTRVVHVINDASERAVKVLQGFPMSEF